MERNDKASFSKVKPTPPIDSSLLKKIHTNAKFIRGKSNWTNHHIILLSRRILYDPPIAVISYTSLQAKDHFLKQVVDKNDDFSQKLQVKDLWKLSKGF